MKSTKRIFLTLIVSTICLLLVFTNLSSQQTAGELYEKALFMEEAKGDLQKAIDLYQKILKQFPENREIAAQAQLHIGLCYEKLGLKEAQKAYQKVIDSYPEQTEAVQVAKEKLSVLLRAQAVVEKGDKEFRMRQVWAGPDVDDLGAPSPDGKYLSFVDWNTGDLAIRELATGKKRGLTKKGSWIESPEFALYSRWSPDGKQVAYSWLNEDNFFELRIIGLDGSEPRVLYRNEEVHVVVPSNWSPDGKHILALYQRIKDVTFQIVIVSVADGSVRVLKKCGKLYPGGGLFSPDGRYIVYDFPPKEDSWERDIFLLSTDGNREIPLIEHPAHDFVMGWAPDGKNLLFASDRTGTPDAWIIQVTDGKPQGDPELIKKDIGQISPMGFTREGSFYYSLQTGMRDVYIATLDLEKGKLLSQPTKATQRFVGSNFAPDWSPDGQYLAYISERGPEPGGLSSLVLCILSVKTGEVRELFPQLTSFGRLRWSPDGRSILVEGSDKKDRNGLYTIDAQTGDITLIVQSEPGAIIRHSAWSLDGKAIFYPYTYWDKQLSRILLRDLDSGQDREIYRKVAPPDVGRVTLLTLSPDGQQLAFLTADKETPAHVLRVIPSAGGESRDLLRMSQEQIASYAWTADGREILFATRFPSVEEQKCELWRIPVEGGEPQKLGLAMDRLQDLRVHPDGKRITFTAGKASKEVWVMENFLPEEKPQKKTPSRQ